MDNATFLTIPNNVPNQRFNRQQQTQIAVSEGVQKVSCNMMDSGLGKSDEHRETIGGFQKFRQTGLRAWRETDFEEYFRAWLECGSQSLQSRC